MRIDDATKLGIEALKEVQRIRPYYPGGAYPSLKGETEQ